MKQTKNEANAPHKKPLTKYWNGKTSDHPIIQHMIMMDNSLYQIHPNKFGEAVLR